MSVSTKISKALRRFGRPMALRRLNSTGGLVAEVTVYGTTDGAAINRMIQAAQQTDSHVVFSNAEIAAQNWPGPPKKGDKMMIDGALKTLGPVEGKYLGAEILVWLCQVTG